MELKTQLMILGIAFALVTIGFACALIWVTKVVEKQALAKKAAKQTKQAQEPLRNQSDKN